MIQSKFKSLIFLYFFMVLTPLANATDLQIYGFADIVGSQTSTDFSLNDIGNHKRELAFDPESRLGLNLSSPIGDNYAFASQLLARGSDKGAYSLSADWIFVTYKPNDRVAIRAGRQISPTFLFSEQIDVGYTYMWVRLPYEIYGFYPIKSFNGFSLIYTLPIKDFTLKAQVLGGSSDLSVSRPSYTLESTANDIRGADVSLSSEQAKVHLAYIATRSDATVSNVGTFDFGTIELWSLGASFNWQNFITFIEASHMVGNQSAIESSSSIYGSLGYQVSSTLTPYITFAEAADIKGTIFTNPTISPAVPTTTKSKQYSYMVGLNYKANPSLIFKGEYMRTEQEFVDVTKNFGANTFTATMDIIF